jgi:hypothetical protein
MKHFGEMVREKVRLSKIFTLQTSDSSWWNKRFILPNERKNEQHSILCFTRCLLL